MISSYLEYVTLASKLAEYHHAYHVENKELIPDHEYDALRKELIQWEETHPGQTLELSPTFQVGARAPGKSNNEHLRHEYPMKSLENALDEDQMLEWVENWLEVCEGDPISVGEYKYDGMALSLLYIDGGFTRALTRGDGEYGEDVTRHAAFFVPERIAVGGRVEVRGEAMIDNSTLRQMNLSGEDYANGRNAVAGMLNRDKPNAYTASIMFAPYDIEGKDLAFEYHTDKIETIRSLGFHTHGVFVVPFDKINEVFQTVTALRDSNAIPYPIDGMVFKINNLRDQALLGETNHHPKHSFAYKFPPTIGQCTLVDVVFQIGRTGELAPVAKITATPLMGVVVTSVSLHNEDRMIARKIAIGNRYEIYRSGDVIPHFGKLLEEVPNAQPVKFPEKCPCCNSPVVKRGAAYYCDNVWCSDRLVAGIAYAASRDVLDIDGLAENTIRLMVDAGLVKCTADLYQLTEEQVAKLDGYTDYSARKLVSAIRESRDTTMDRFITALGIMEVGKSTARKLSHRVRVHAALFELNSPEKILELKVADVGPSTAANIAAYFANPQKKDDAIRLYKALLLPMFDVDDSANIDVPGVTGKSFVFTGRFPEAREALENRVLAAGGRVSSSISGKTDYLVLGEGGGDKRRKAELLGVEAIDYRVFISFFN